MYFLRYNTFLKSDFKDWSEQDDQKLLQLVKEHGSKDWVKIASHLEGKNRTQCRNRFHVIYKAYVRDQDQFSLNKLNNSSLQRKRQRTLYTRLENKLGEFLECQKELRLEEDEGGFRKVDLQGFHTTADGVSGSNDLNVTLYGVSFQHQFRLFTFLDQDSPAGAVLFHAQPPRRLAGEQECGKDQIDHCRETRGSSSSDICLRPHEQAWKSDQDVEEEDWRKTPETAGVNLFEIGQDHKSSGSVFPASMVHPRKDQR